MRSTSCCPSLPGYGFSAEPAELGWDLGRTARAWAELMRRLGYSRYVAQGGDVGAGVTDAMGRQAPEGLIGIHTNLLVPALSGPMPTDTDEERAAAAQLATFRQSGNGYFVEMATRPQTIGYALLDSPVALAAWMIDHDTDAYYKIARAFVDGQPSGNLTRDHILDNITLYWLTGTGASAARSYWEAYGPDAPAAAGQPLPATHDPVRLHDVPGRDLADAAQLGRGELSERHLLQRGRQGRPLRRLGGAGALLDRGASGVQVAARRCARDGRAFVSSSTQLFRSRLPSAIETRALFGQTMGLVAVTAGLFALGAYVGRDLSYGWGLVAYIASFGAPDRNQLRGLPLRAAGGRPALRLRRPGREWEPRRRSRTTRRPTRSRCGRRAAATALFIAGFGAAGYATRRDLSGLARVCFWALLVLIVFGIVAIFVNIPNSALIYSIAGLVIFAGFTMYDFQRLRRTQDIRAAPTLAASIFLDVLNVFLLLLNLFNRN